MSAIGDYIHYFAKNYNKYGITQNSENEGKYNYSLQKNKVTRESAAAASQMTEKEKIELQKALGRILCTQVEDDKVDKAVEQVQQKITEILQETYQESLGKIDWDTGNITAQSLLGERNEELKKIKIASEQHSVRFTTLLARLKEIVETVPHIKNVKTKNELEAFVEDIYRRLATLSNNTMKSLKTENGINTKSILLTDDLNNLITDINKIVRVIGASAPTNLQKGDLFEYAIALAPAVAKANAEDTIEKEVLSKLAGTVGGKDRSQVRIAYDNFSEHVNWSALAVKGYNLDDTGLFSVLPSQEKIDVNLDLGEGRTAGISAKNVNLSSGFDVHILSGSSLLYMVQDIDADFVNHFLNLTSTHPDSQLLEESEIAAARESMKITLLAKALSGQTYGRKAAEIFVVNDNSKVNTDVKVFDIKSLILKAANDFNSMATLTSGDEDLDSITFNNEWSDRGYEDRLTKLLQDVHAKKISAALKVSSLS